jgi:NAD(P)-dependent dehydrogenase (short-subunit alcohol dehydrogenase family)
MMRSTRGRRKKEWVAETISHFGGIDGLVLNAGIMMKRTVLEATDEDFDMMFAVNVKSPMRLSQLAWPHLQKKPGRIVVMSSLSGKRVRSAGAGLYGMSKFALTALSQALRQCGKESGIRSTAICPSYVATDMAQGLASASEEELTRPEDIAILIRTILSLPPSASIAEVPVNWTVEECY